MCVGPSLLLLTPAPHLPIGWTPRPPALPPSQLSTLSCAYYVFKIEKGSSGSTMLKDTADEEAALEEQVAE